ncbi:protease inhibitor [Nonomuraea sp. MG754425]|uniref:SSI family serine proteinase inhibitor n=1 Tax=Nonomuraea sp. MG754425 TaxID=2570319 RepID=UPI0023513E1F|nr:SSI family serine proteinase inhibitor [Nonomuraea sp. MG754425]MCF6475161.1 protease inhibitor [Nonomuraea sp. MG754425]
MRLPLLVAGAGLSVGLVLASLPAYGAARVNGVFLAVSAHGGNTMRAVGLQCPGVTRGHPYGEVACAVIDAVDGDFDRLPGNPRRRCSEEQAPVTATMGGLWQNRNIGWHKTFRNACVLYAETGPVFRF